MRQLTWTEEAGWASDGAAPPTSPASLALVFGDREALGSPTALAELGDRFPGAIVVGCSTAGQIRGASVIDRCIVATVVGFEQTRVATATVKATGGDSRAAGRRLAEQMVAPDLAHVLVFSEGIDINGSELVRGLGDSLPAEVTVTGGLAADGERFGETLVVCGRELCTHGIAAVGLYGTSLRVGYGSFGGWDPFGPERLVTRADRNVLFELDGQSALALYKTYLGEHAQRLPASGLLFPLSLRVDDAAPVVRTILAIDEAAQSMTFAGDIPEGGYVRLMKANFDRLIDGAAEAGRISGDRLRGSRPDLALLISCVGRRMVLRQRVEEEVEAALEAIGAGTTATGFYSYGEISPFTPSARCELHNQTMTITTLSER
ncbi:MAG: FIST N-terminal domain-containing protein [Acidobacteriota bacterium]